MPSAILNVTFDCHDAQRVAEFWGAVTGYVLEHVDDPGNPYWVASPPAGGRPRLVFVTVPERKSVKNRVHLDVMPGVTTRQPRSIGSWSWGQPSSTTGAS